MDSGNNEKVLKRCRLLRRQTVQSKKFCAKDERNASLKKVSVILQKSETDRTFEESQVLSECSEVVEEVQLRWRKRDEAKRRMEEFEESPEILRDKCQILAQAVAQSQHLVVYTGAGISTAAKIPDYRGPNGIWTRLQQGKDIGNHDLSLAEPTFTHMALAELYKKKILKYVVSQNCDGLHLRSGLPRTALSELHGNMYIEVCKNCKPHKEYWRLFDVTENTARYAHKTFRKCYVCNGPLVDTIVHFGERGNLQWPLNWSGACKNAEKATTILCLGSSLKVLKKYPWLWQMDKPAKKRPNLYIVNLQWTPKDDVANVKIHGKCDKVMKILMKILDIDVTPYNKLNDPIFTHFTQLNDMELHTTSQPSLKLIENDIKIEQLKTDLDINNEKDCAIKNDLTDNDLKSVKSNICDTISNSKLTNHIDKLNNSLPLKLENKASSALKNVFSIDNILQLDTNNKLPHNTSINITNNVLTQSSYAFFNYGNIKPDLWQYQLLGSYSDLILYPYQTSFLYPGLHSIINPIPFTNDDDIKHNIINQTEQQQINNNIEIQPSCEYCDKHYNTINCLFYPKTESVFNNQQFRFSKIEQQNKPNICVCCDYSTDEDTTTIDTIDIKEQYKSKIQAGWFGKGYKKNRRLKKK